LSQAFTSPGPPAKDIKLKLEMKALNRRPTAKDRTAECSNPEQKISIIQSQDQKPISRSSFQAKEFKPKINNP